MYLLHYAILSFLFVKTNVNDNSNLILPNHKIQKGIMLSIILFPCYLASLSPGNYKSYFFVLFSGAEPKNDSLIIQSFYNGVWCHLNQNFVNYFKLRQFLLPSRVTLLLTDATIDAPHNKITIWNGQFDFQLQIAK